jgi:hypothetical protein
MGCSKASLACCGTFAQAIFRDVHCFERGLLRIMDSEDSKAAQAHKVPEGRLYLHVQPDLVYPSNSTNE